MGSGGSGTGGSRRRRRGASGSASRRGSGRGGAAARAQIQPNSFAGCSRCSAAERPGDDGRVLALEFSPAMTRVQPHFANSEQRRVPDGRSFNRSRPAYPGHLDRAKRPRATTDTYLDRFNIVVSLEPNPYALRADMGLEAAAGRSCSTAAGEQRAVSHPAVPDIEMAASAPDVVHCGARSINLHTPHIVAQGIDG